ncbi:hypothetical protein NEOLEDRAFT_1134750 [Neolentinus lepideus HHB14362 ss-1]|uniref:PHD-type domain-containing protein n=1 Tax=Neolentinus lepideus HHB14362 ss-1 TaxID=1314782 RepID=A0A165S5F3_9AGAM|nr:hypothetical protein NEOLEDRAFT_1134750 [Neolentinus lepideus HHB14362 ss-1]
MPDLSPKGTTLSISTNADPSVSDNDIAGRYVQSSNFASDQGLQMTPHMASTSLLLADNEQGNSGLLPPFGYQQNTHLPTPQSPKHAYLRGDASRLSPESPLLNRHHQAPLLAPVPLSRRATLAHEGSKLRAPHIMTPDSSPPAPPVTPPPSSPPVQPLDATPKQEPLKLPKVDVNATPLGPAAIISSPRSAHSGEKVGHSRLSSPFMEKLSITSRSHRSVSPPTRALDPDDVFTAPPGIDVRPARAESARLQALRMKYLTGQSMAESEAEIEARRPDYLKRLQPSGTLSLDDLTSMNTSARLGIKDSPVKGRRIQLFQETSEESFEESLMAGGYPRYGSGSGYDVPRTPGKDRSSELSEHTLAWLQQSTPGAPGPSKVVEPETPPDERALKKRKRLAAFQRDGSVANATLPRRKLVPVYVEGRGRVLMDVPPEDAVVEDDAPAKRKKNRRRKPAAASVGLPSLVKQGIAATTGPNWPDEQFPWCVRRQEREELAQAEEEERLRRIAEFLERDSGDEDSDPDEELLPPATWGQVHEYPPKPSRMGRGKMVPLRANPGGGHSVHGSVYLPSGPADARAALLSKRAARRLRYRLQHPESEDDEADTISCICRGRNDGEEAVQCDRCDGWYHLSCVGLRSVADLGPADTIWYCPKCTSSCDDEERTPSPDLVPSSEPTLVPGDDRPAPRTPRDPLFFDPSVQESRTPERNLFSTPTFNFLSSSPGKDGFDPTSTPSRGVALSRFGLFSTPGQGVFGSGSVGGRLSFSGDAFSTPVRASVMNINADDTPVRRSETGSKEQLNLPER